MQGKEEGGDCFILTKQDNAEQVVFSEQVRAGHHTAGEGTTQQGRAPHSRGGHDTVGQGTTQQGSTLG